MRIKNIEIKSAAVEIRWLPFTPACCDTCDEESGEVEVEINGAAHLHMAMGPYCAEKYLRAFAS